MSSGDDFDAHLDVVLIGGREERDVQIVDYSEAWPPRFEAGQRRIQLPLGETARRIEHIGSTAVPGLAGKAIVDIIVNVKTPEDESA